jgi:hypothetical protein
MNECVYVYPKTRKQRAYIGKRDRERREIMNTRERESEHKDSTNTSMDIVHARERERERVNTKIVRTPGWVSYRRERSEKREKRDHAHKGRRNTGTGAKKRCRKRSRNTVDGASIWPTQRVSHNRECVGETVRKANSPTEYESIENF